MKDDWFEGSLFDESELDTSIKIEKEKKTYNTRKKEETDDNLFHPGLFEAEEDKTIYVESIPNRYLHNMLICCFCKEL